MINKAKCEVKWVNLKRLDQYNTVLLMMPSEIVLVDRETVFWWNDSDG